MPKQNIKLYGYARVSSQTQCEDRQVLALLACGVAQRNIFVDKQSGKDFNRPKYDKFIKGSGPAIRCLSRVSTGWGGTMRKSSSNYYKKIRYKV